MGGISAGSVGDAGSFQNIHGRSLFACAIIDNSIKRLVEVIKNPRLLNHPMTVHFHDEQLHQRTSMLFNSSIGVLFAFYSSAIAAGGKLKAEVAISTVALVKCYIGLQNYKISIFFRF